MYEGHLPFQNAENFDIYFKNAKITPETAFGWEDKWVRTCCMKFCLLWEEYMWSAVNVLKYGPNIWNPTKRHDTEVTLFDINGKLP